MNTTQKEIPMRTLRFFSCVAVICCATATGAQTSNDWALRLGDPNYNQRTGKTVTLDKLASKGVAPAPAHDVLRVCKRYVEQAAVLNSFALTSYDLVEHLPAVKSSSISKFMEHVTKGDVYPTKIYYTKTSGEKAYMAMYVYKDPFGAVNCIRP